MGICGLAVLAGVWLRASLLTRGLVNITAREAKRAVTLAVWLSGNALVSVNEVELRRARLVPEGVTVLGQVNYICAEPAF